MPSHRRAPLHAGLMSAWRDVRAAAALEFAIVAMPFILALLFVFELSYDLFVQEALDSGLHQAVRQIQTGSAQNVTNGAAFITKYLCPAVAGLLSCSGLYINVQKLSLTYPQDYWNATTGKLPVNAGALNLSGFSSASFCNSGPSEMLLVQAIYVSPTFVGGVLPNVMSWSYGGSIVHAALSQVAAVTENYSASALTTGAAAAC